MAKNNLLPVVILFVIVGLLAFVGFVAYTIVQDISNKTKAKMEKKHVIFSKDGMKVGVKEINDEEYKDRSQRCVDGSSSHTDITDVAVFSVLVNVWNHTSFPAYKSRLWNTGATPEPPKKLTKR